MSDKNVYQITVLKLGHAFAISVKEDGTIECAIDGDLVAVDSLAEGSIKFAEKQKIKVNGTLMGIGGLSLSEDEFTAIKKEQEVRTSVSLQKKQKQEIAEPIDSVEKSEDEDSAANEISAAESQEVNTSIEGGTVHHSEAKSDLDEEHWEKLWEGRNVAKKLVDSWKRSVRSYKDKEKKGQKYCVHNIRIGNNKYRFVERQIPGKGIVVNPDYKILDDMPRVGGVPRQYGELMFWDYLFDDKGWQRVRVLTYNERICLDIIRQYGYFAIPRDKEKMLKGKNSFFKKPKKKTAEGKEFKTVEPSVGENKK